MDKKYKIIIGLILTGIIGILLIYKSPLGGSLIKGYLLSKISFIRNFEVKSFSYSFNNFSVDFRREKNKISMFGSMFPFNAVYEAKLLNLELITPEFRGSVLSSGNVKDEKGVNVSGNAIFADGYGEFNVNLGDVLNGYFKGNGFNLKELLYMLKIDFPYVNGESDFSIRFVKNLLKTQYTLNKGKIRFKSLDIPFNATGKVLIMDRKNFDLDSDFVSSVGRGELSLSVKGGRLHYSGNVQKLNLAVLKSFTLYPFKDFTDISFRYSDNDNIFNFKSRDFEGYYDGKTYIQLKKQSLKRFFTLLGLKPFALGEVTGSITIDKNRGSFDLLFNNTRFLINRYVRYIRRTSGVNLAYKQTVFVKGFFNKKYLVFNVLSKGSHFSFSIEKGKFFYDKKFRFYMTVVKKGTLYKYKVNNYGIRLMEIKVLDTTASDTLVY